MDIKIIPINHKNGGKPHFIDVNAYHHTIYPNDSLPNYHVAEYKLCQTKIVNNQLFTVGLNEGIELLDDSIKSLTVRKFKSRKKLYAGRAKSISVLIDVSTRPFLYKLENWHAFNNEDRAQYVEEIESLGSYKKGSTGMRSWHCDVLRGFLEVLMIRHLNYMVNSLQETVPMNNFYVSIQPGITSSLKRHMHGEKGSTYPIVFDLYFTSNLHIPPLVSIGNGVSIGFGTVIEV